MVNTAIVLAAVEGNIATADRSLQRQYGGSLVLTKAWAKSLLSRMGFGSARVPPLLKDLLLSLKSERSSIFWTFVLKS